MFQLAHSILRYIHFHKFTLGKRLPENTTNVLQLTCMFVGPHALFVLGM